MALDIELGSGVSLVFTTPILIRKMRDVDTINENLRRAILKAEAEDKGSQFSNVGGWQSAATLLEWPIPEIGTLRGWIEEATIQMSSLPFQAPVSLEYRAGAWANVNRNGDYNRIHSHGEDHWAVVYYVSCGEPEPGRRMNGNIELRDPRSAAGHAGDRRYPGFTFGHGLLIDPEPGMLIAFPAWLEHQVHPFFGRGERISIAANVRVKNVRKGPPE